MNDPICIRFRTSDRRGFVQCLLPWLLALAGALGSAEAAGPVVIDEVLADNRRTIQVADRFPDYIELRNRSGVEVDIGGCILADDSATSLPLVFATGTRVAPGGRLIVWCHRDSGLPAPQANFGLGATGDRLRLTGVNGEVWDEIAFGLQIPDGAIGRVGGDDADLGEWRLVRPSPGAANAAMELGSPDRLRINEWMAAPSTGDDWIELFNGDERPVNLSGMRLTDRSTLPPANRPIPALSFAPASGFIQFFASDLRQSGADHLDFRLGAGGDQVLLVDAGGGVVLDRVTFGSQASNVSGGRTPDGGETIVAFPAGQSTPGASNGRDLTRVVISEVLAHTDPPFEDAIELSNATAQSADIGGWWLSDAGSTPRKFRIPTGTVLPAGGTVVFYEYQFGSGPGGFSLNSYEGDEVWLSVGDVDGNVTGERTGVRFGATRNAVSLGRVSTTAGPDFAPLMRPTFGVDAPTSVARFRQGSGGPNAEPMPPVVALAEWFPASSGGAVGGRDEPFVEWHNPGSSAVPLFDPLYPTNAWRLRGDLRFDLPTGITLEPGGRLLIVGFDPSVESDRLRAFRTAHGIADSIRILGPWSGAIEDDEPSLELQAPDFPEGPDKPRPGFVPYVRVDRVDYRPRSGWPVLTPGSGRSLRRLDSRQFGNEPGTWAVDLPSPGRERPDPVTIDGDDDGLPDVWESANGLDPADPADAGFDADGDGARNRDEYLAGTDPRRADDVLRLGIRPVMDGVQLTFRAVAGRTYRVERRAFGETGPWTDPAWPVTADGTTETNLVFPTDGGAWGFRVTIPEAP